MPGTFTFNRLYKAKEVSDERYLIQLVAYVHLNPVKAGLAKNADEYRLSGHRDIIGGRRNPIVAVDDVLLLYGQTRRAALRNYRAALASVDTEDWSGDGPGRLPWWRLGRPTEEERLRRREGAFVDEQGRSTARWRPKYGATEWLEVACTHLNVDWKELGDRGRHPEVVSMGARYGVTEFLEVHADRVDGGIDSPASLIIASSRASSVRSSTAQRIITP